jgi:hypothetical protein
VQSPEFKYQYQQNNKSSRDEDTYIPMFTETQFAMAKLWNQHRCPLTGEWTKKMRYVYTMEYYAVIKKNKITCRKTDGTGDYYVKRNKIDLESNITFFFSFWESRSQIP